MEREKRERNSRSSVVIILGERGERERGESACEKGDYRFKWYLTVAVVTHPSEHPCNVLGPPMDLFSILRVVLKSLLLSLSLSL